MIVAGALIVFAVALGVGLPKVLVRAAWPNRAPRLAIATWQAASLSAVFSTVLAGVVMAVPTAGVSGGLAQLLRSCAFAIRHSYATPQGAAAAGTGIVLALSTLARTSWCLSAELGSASRRRRRHGNTLALVGKTVPGLDAVVVTHDSAVAYCLPGRSRRVVLTSGALNALHPEQLAAVLAHERAHIAGRHHLILAGVDGLARAFRAVPLFRVARDEVTRLVEVVADDVATCDHDRLTVAGALVALAGNQAPVGALAAGGSTALMRVRRLMAPPAPLGRLRGLAGALAVAAVLITPVALAAGPALALSGMHYCLTPADQMAPAHSAAALARVLVLSQHGAAR